MQGIEPTLEILRARAHRTPKGLFRPARYFLAGSGVLTLAFEGFPTPFLDLKEALVHGLHPEYPGSLWPKITLAAQADPHPLTDDEIQLIWQATEQADAVLAANRSYMEVDELCVVEALTRSLEMTGSTVHFHLGGDPSGAISPAHADFVQRVLAQWTRTPNEAYRQTLKRHGHARDHYQRPCRAFTLVAYITDELPGLDQLRDRLARVLPDRFHWFDPGARHLTVRTLEPSDELSELESVEFFGDDDLEARA